MQAKFLFRAAYTTKIFPLYPLRYEVELQKISSYLTLLQLCWDVPHLKGSSAALLLFCDLDTTVWPGSRAPATCIWQTQIHIRQWGYIVFGDMFHVAALSPTRTKVSHPCTDAHGHGLSHLVICCNKCVPPSHGRTLLGSSALLGEKSRIRREVTLAY